MYHLKATKTSLYKLVQDKTQQIPWVNLPKFGKTRFQKAFRRPDYSLAWYDGRSFRAFLSVCGGDPLLSVDAYDHDACTSRREVIKLTLEELQERGMVEEIKSNIGNRR